MKKMNLFFAIFAALACMQVQAAHPSKKVSAQSENARVEATYERFISASPDDGADIPEDVANIIKGFIRAKRFTTISCPEGFSNYGIYVNNGAASWISKEEYDALNKGKKQLIMQIEKPSGPTLENEFKKLSIKEQ